MVERQTTRASTALHLVNQAWPITSNSDRLIQQSILYFLNELDKVKNFTQEVS